MCVKIIDVGGGFRKVQCIYFGSQGDDLIFDFVVLELVEVGVC